MEIDDGTSAWGDPSSCNRGNVNMWSKGAGAEPDAQAPPPPVRPQAPPPPPVSAAPAKEKTVSPGWGEQYRPPPKPVESSTWGEPTPPPVSVDNGTSAWGKPVDASSTWEGPGRECGAAGLGRRQQLLQGGSPHTNMPEEEVEIGMWSNSTSGQQDASGAGSWSYAKKIPQKLNKGVSKQEESWMNPFVKQFNNMSYSREAADETLKCNKMDMPAGMLGEKRMEGERPVMNMGEYNSAMGKGPNLRHHLPPKESSADRGPYYDKNVSGMYGGGSAGAGQGRGAQQPPGPPLNQSQPTLRAQVPPPLLPSQVPPSVLKYPLNNSGMGPLFGPQQVAVLNQLNQLSQINQLQRLLLQQQKLQSQRNMAASMRQHQEMQGRPQMMPPPDSSSPRPSLMKSGLKSYLENYMPQNAPDMQKGQSALGSFSNFPLGLNSNLNVNSLDMGGVGFKEPQSRLNKWMDMGGSSPLDQKPGVLSSGLRLEDSLFGPHDFMNSGNAPESQPPRLSGRWLAPPCQIASRLRQRHLAARVSPGRTLGRISEHRPRD
ncbi:hypothetical protein AAFF_G00160470 [Aldrovandia affinis]|uniref:Uncharacterized protein n=1 Tax=Aldrovandia affinis TaxID=143900 RepID=A0AAD7RN00_9TELE|nr:hypothetical protein AAFF_G00160470 [Aldrovandia affinis]